MIAKPFYLLKKILFTTKFTTNLKILFTNKSQTIKSHFLEKIIFITKSKEKITITTNQTTKVKNPF